LRLRDEQRVRCLLQVHSGGRRHNKIDVTSSNNWYSNGAITHSRLSFRLIRVIRNTDVITLCSYYRKLTTDRVIKFATRNKPTFASSLHVLQELTGTTDNVYIGLDDI